MLGNTSRDSTHHCEAPDTPGGGDVVEVADLHGGGTRHHGEAVRLESRTRTTSRKEEPHQRGHGKRDSTAGIERRVVMAKTTASSMRPP